MKKHLKALLILLIVFSLTFNMIGCNNKQEDPPPEITESVSVLNEISWTDVDPTLLIKGENIVFNALISDSDFEFAGAFRNLRVGAIQPIDNSTLLVITHGEIYPDDARGYIFIDRTANSTGKNLTVEVDIGRINYGRESLGGGFFVELGLDLLKGIAATGVEKAFGYGLDKLLYDKLGLNIVTLKTIQSAVEELGRKIDDLSVQITEMEGRLTDVINQSTKEILTNEYLNTFENINTLVTSIKTDTLALWNNIATIQATAGETSEEYRTLVVAELLTFSELEGKNVSPLVSNVAELLSYIDGSYFSMNPESLYSRFLKIGCTRSVFVGESAILVSNYLNSLNSIAGEAIDVMTIICQAKYFTHRQLNVTANNPEYKDVINFVDGEAVESKELIINLEELAKTDEDLKNRLSSSAVIKYKDKANGSIWQNYLLQIKNNVSRIFDDTNADSVLSKYNSYVYSHCYSYNKSYTVSGDYITLDLVDLRPDVSCTGSAECGTMSEWTDSNYKSKATEINDTANYYIHQCMTDSELNTFFKRLMSNESGLLFRNLTKEDEFTITDVLTLYGFSVPGEGSTPYYYPIGNKVDESRGQLSINGFPTTSKISVDKYGKITSAFGDAADYPYYRYKDYMQDRCYFYYFTEEVLISTVDEFAEYIYNVINGKPYACAKLTADLDLTGVDWEEVWPSSKANVEFRGTFNGNNHVISNFTYNEGSNGGCNFGLFRTVGEDAVIRNLTFENVNINCESSSNVGACVGEITSSATLSEIKVLGGTVKGDSNVGGIVGRSGYPNTMSVCHNYAEISGKNYVGGLIGRSESGGTQIFSSCKNFGNVTSTLGTAGGIVSSINGSVTFKSTTNDGKIRAYNNAGGLASSVLGTLKATSSVNNGEVISENMNAGGLIGSITSKYSITVSKCDNNGKITGSNSAGGLAGNYLNDHAIISHTVEEFRNTGDVTAEKYAGGLFGYGLYFYMLQITDSSNSGNITATGRSAGGIIGETSDVINLAVINTTNTGTVSGKAYTDKIIGRYDTSKSRIIIQ